MNEPNWLYRGHANTVKLVESHRFGDYVTLFADASYCDKTKAFGWCFWAKFGNPAQTIVESGGGLGMKNSTLAEIEAVMQALKFAEGMMLRGKTIVLQSDCAGAIENTKVRARLYGLVNLGARNAYTKHVKGHQGHSTARSSVNTLCDRHAKQQMKMYRQKAQE